MDGLGHHPIPCYEQDFYGDAFIADPLPHYAAMRGLGPVVFLPVLGNYAITRYDEVRQVLRHFEVFSSAQGVVADQVGCDFLRGVHGNTLNSDRTGSTPADPARTMSASATVFISASACTWLGWR